MPPLLTVVTPVLGDAEALAALLPHLPDGPDLEVVVVDGGRDPRLDALVAGRSNAALIRSPAGRARQMNAGAAAARGDWLLFLHADSRLPPGWVAAFHQMAPGVAGGWFRFAFDDEAWQARAIEWATRWRVRLLRLPYGDQGYFVRRTLFESMGGFTDMPLLEDVEFIARLRRAGRTVELPLELRTSARRYRRDGWLRRSAENVAIVALYVAGVDPARLARRYRGVHG